MLAPEQANLIASDQQVKNELAGAWRTAARFLFELCGIVLTCWLFMLAYKIGFIINFWPALRPSGSGAILGALLNGLRFDAAILCWLLIPACLLHYLAATTRWRAPRWGLLGYLVALTLGMLLLLCADLQYFEESGKHLTYEATAYLNASARPIISGAFHLHPWLCSLSLAGCLLLTGGIGWAARRLLHFSQALDRPRRWMTMATLPVVAIVLAIGTRGGLQSRPLDIGHACVSPSPYINALCLNPVYSALKSATDPARQEYHFFDTGFCQNRVRELLKIDPATIEDARYPLLRTSSGTPQGNRRNVVIFILESWSGKDIDCLGGRNNVTPFFDSLAREGLLFTNFHATGIRTAEGIFSIMCSFPNQPVKPIMDRSVVYQTHWRSLPQILAEAGYRNLFIHGRDLDFDQMRAFLRSLHFDTIIDRRHGFPPSVSQLDESWPGYSDEEVFKRADEEFSRQQGPFFGVIYTLCTHPPFVVPDGFPKAFPPTTSSNKFLNSLKYSDETLRQYFTQAKSSPYFNNTIFILMADHARTRDRFNQADQSFIPLLIYAPGLVQPGTITTTGSQLDVLPTVLGLLGLKARHAAWGRDLTTAQPEEGFATNVIGDEVRWHSPTHLLSDSLTSQPPLLFDTRSDPTCTTDIGPAQPALARQMQTDLRAWLTLSQAMLYGNSVYP